MAGYYIYIYIHIIYTIGYIYIVYNIYLHILDNKNGVDFAAKCRGSKNKDGELKTELVIFTDGRSDLWHSRIYNKQLLTTLYADFSSRNGDGTTSKRF